MIIRKIKDILRWIRGDNPAWAKIEYFNEGWKKRILAMCELIEEEQTVLDLGCGKMWLKSFLPASIKYIGCDYKRRSDEVLVCDFNKKEFPPIKVDVCFVSGCLEYINDSEWFINRIAECSPSLILSYCTTNLNSDLRKRKSLGWKNHLSYESLTDLLESAGFSLRKGGIRVDGNEIMKFILSEKGVPYQKDLSI